MDKIPPKKREKSHTASLQQQYNRILFVHNVRLTENKSQLSLIPRSQTIKLCLLYDFSECPLNMRSIKYWDEKFKWKWTQRDEAFIECEFHSKHGFCVYFFVLCHSPYAFKENHTFTDAFILSEIQRAYFIQVYCNGGHCTRLSAALHSTTKQRK